MIRHAPDRQTIQTAMWLNTAATEVTQARLILTERIAYAHNGTTDNPTEHTPVTTSRGQSTTERHAMEALGCQETLTELQDRLEGIRVATRDLRRWLHDQVLRRHGTVQEIEVTMCRDHQGGKEGAISWGDPTCAFPADKAGLCATHYMAWYRHRRAMGIDTSRDFAA